MGGGGRRESWGGLRYVASHQPMIRFDGRHWIASGGPICPDRLTLAMLGEADGARGRIVRAFVRLLDMIMPVRG